MEEQIKLKRQFVLHIIYNMITFSIIFLCFGMFLFLKVRNITFSTVDKQLINSKNEFLQFNNEVEDTYKLFEYDEIPKEEQDNIFLDTYSITRRIRNPQITLILRDENGDILNQDELGRIENYASEIQFDNNFLDNIYSLKIENTYNYRALNFEMDTLTNNIKYIQLVVNSDSEIQLLNRYFEIIMYAVVVGIFLSGIASCILSRKTLKPVEEILQKQTEFVQNASHELRTPLTIIQAKQELLLQDPNAKIIDKSEEIMLTLSETKRLTKLVKDLMVLVKGTNLKNSNLQKEDIYMDEFIEKLVVPYTEIAESQDKEFKLNLNFNKDISVDVNKMHQLMVILLDNAIKYTESGDTIQINTYCKDNKCIIEVCDTGIGISDEALNRVFERFYREDKARNRETGGSGLGLSIASMIVTAHNGTIKAVHNNPKGTIFIIKLNR